MWQWLANALLTVLSWLAKVSAAPAVQEASQTGVAQEAAAQAVSGEKAAQAEAQAVLDSPRDVAGVAKELDDGTF